MIEDIGFPVSVSCVFLPRMEGKVGRELWWGQRTEWKSNGVGRGVRQSRDLYHGSEWVHKAQF